jgi:hypothetical protein
MTAHFAPVHDDQQQSLCNEGRKQRNNAEIPYMPGIDACYPCRALCEKQREQDAQRSKRTIGRDENCSDVKENWVHLSQDTAFD